MGPEEEKKRVGLVHSLNVSGMDLNIAWGLAEMDEAERHAGVRLTQRHAHVWSWFTLRRMLEVAQPALAARGQPFRVVEQYTTDRRRPDAMKEFRVALEKV